MPDNMTTRNVHVAAQRCLLSTDITEKVARVQQLQEAWQAGQLQVQAVPLDDHREAGRPARPELVAPRQVQRRKFSTPAGQAALIHAVAHIEFNAINLACDAVSRYHDLPVAYYADWIQVAAEEAKHFGLLQDRLAATGYQYGDFPAHNGLWELAQTTADNFVQRMAIVPRVMEARGLDVTPGMIKRFEQVGDTETAAVLHIILDDEIGHVAIGSRWYQYACIAEGLEPEAHYLQLLRTEFRHLLRTPFHTEARLAAGFSAHELEQMTLISATNQRH